MDSSQIKRGDWVVAEFFGRPRGVVQTPARDRQYLTVVRIFDGVYAGSDAAFDAYALEPVEPPSDEEIALQVLAGAW